MRYVAGKDTEGLTEALFSIMLARILRDMSVGKEGRTCRVLWFARGAGEHIETAWGSKMWKEYELWGEAGRTGVLEEERFRLHVEGWETEVVERGLCGVKGIGKFWRRWRDWRAWSGAEEEEDDMEFSVHGMAGVAKRTCSLTDVSDVDSGTGGSDVGEDDLQMILCAEHALGRLP
jgi:hypothetical protein